MHCSWTEIRHAGLELSEQKTLRRVQGFGSCFSEEVSTIKNRCQVNEDKTSPAVIRCEEEDGVTVAEATEMTGYDG